MNTTETSITQPATAQSGSEHYGVFQVSTEGMHRLMPEISIDNTDTQGHLRDTGVFARLHDRFLLPDSYIVRNVFYEHLRGIWNVFIESPDLPDCNAILGEDTKYPLIEPLYCREGNGALHLVEIKVHIERTVPVLGGMQWFLKAL